MLLFSRLLLLTSALWPARARCGAIREATLPPCSPPPLPLPGPALPLVCPFSLVLPCPPSQAPVFLALCLPVSVFPLPPRHTLCGAIRVASLPLSLHLSALRCPGPLASDTHVALHPPVAFFPSMPALPPPPVPALCPLCHYAGHCVGKSQACRRHAPGLYRWRHLAGWHHAAAARRCHSPRRSRRRRQLLQMPRGARPWLAPAAPRPGFSAPAVRPALAS